MRAVWRFSHVRTEKGMPDRCRVRVGSTLSRDGDFVDVTARCVFLRHRVILESGTPRMLVPDAELNVAEMGGRLPSKYKGMMLFSNLGRSEVGTDILVTF